MKAVRLKGGKRRKQRWSRTLMDRMLKEQFAAIEKVDTIVYAEGAVLHRLLYNIQAFLIYSQVQRFAYLWEKMKKTKQM